MRILLIACVGFLLCVALVTAVASAGSETTQDSVHVANAVASVEVWTFAPDPMARIGGAPADSGFFSTMGRVLILRDTSLLVGEHGPNKVRLFSRTGQFVRQVLGDGDGPQRIRVLTDMFTNAHDSVYIPGSDNRLFVLDPLGAHARTVDDYRYASDSTRFMDYATMSGRLEGPPELAGVLDDGTVVTMHGSGYPRDAVYGGRFDPPPPFKQEPGPAASVRTFRRGKPGGARLADFGSFQLWRGYSMPSTNVNIYWHAAVAAAGDAFIYAPGDTLGYQIFSADGKLVRSVTVDRPRLVDRARTIYNSVTDEFELDARPLTRFIPDVFRIIPASDRTLWVESVREATDSNGVRYLGTWYVFDISGKLLRIVESDKPFSVLSVRGDLVAGVGVSDAGRPQVQLLRSIPRPRR